MTAAALHTAGSIRTNACAAGISACLANAIAGLGSTWATRPALSAKGIYAGARSNSAQPVAFLRALSGQGQQPSRKTRAWNTARERTSSKGVAHRCAAPLHGEPAPKIGRSVLLRAFRPKKSPPTSPEFYFAAPLAIPIQNFFQPNRGSNRQ